MKEILTKSIQSNASEDIMSLNLFDKKNRSFQTKLFVQVFVGGFVLSIIAAFGYAYIASSMLKGFYEREGIQATENFARLSELALLYESGENAYEAAMATLDFPGIKHVDQKIRVQRKSRPLIGFEIQHSPVQILR